MTRLPTPPAVAGSRGDAVASAGAPAPGRSGAPKPALTFAPELLLAARGAGEGIGAAIFDVDGVLTDGRIYIGDSGETFKAFSTLDGQGMKLLVDAGLMPIVVSGRDSPALRRRMSELGMVHVAYGARDKMAAAAALVAGLGLGWDRVAAIGDDWPDLPILRRAAFACAPPHAHVEVRAIAHHVTAARAGHGAAREFCDLLLVAAGRYAELLRGPLFTLDGAR
jgi:3-deoxy-D-manno-octulosonate 8-phosphate phosphatase (KDO 8-P phosphatase)